MDIVAAGPVDDYLVGFLQSSIQDALAVETRVGVATPTPTDAFHSIRRQYDSTRILDRFLTAGIPENRKLLVVTGEDLFIPVFTFVFGEAVLGGAVAAMSTYRLRQEFYGLPPDPRRLLLRAEKEALHELGHTFGLVHCSMPDCVMRVSHSVEHVDSKTSLFCESCDSCIQERINVP